MEKKKVYVTIPIVGSVSVEVDVPMDATDAECFSAAIDAVDCKFEDGESTVVGEIQYVERVTTGNVCYAPLNGFEVELA